LHGSGICSRSPLHRNRTRSARAAQVPPHRAPPEGLAGGGHVPDPLGSDTFCRALVRPSAGEADSAGRLRALFELTGAWSTARQRRVASIPWRACFREARCLSPCLRRPRSFEDRLSRSSAKRPVIRGFQGVFHPLRSISERAASAQRTRQRSRPRRVELSPQLVPNLWTNGLRLFHPCRVPCSDGADTGKELGAGGRIGSRTDPARSARGALRTSAFRSIRGSTLITRL
jgi:hypothetical protein